MFQWGWGRRLLLLLGGLILATYFGLLSWGGVDEAVQWLASKAGASGSFRDPVAGRGEAYVIVMAFLFLTPLAILVALFLLVFVVVVLAGTLRPVGRMLGLPQWALMVLVTGVLAGVGYAKTAVWLPWALRVSGIVVHAFLSLAP